jgi:hypothetical protein
MIGIHPLAAAFGTAGLVCQLVWPMLRGRKAILSLQFGIGANYSLSYALMDAWSGAGVAALGATQTAVTIIAGDRPELRFLGVACLPTVAAISYATWCGLPSMLALAAVTLIMVGRMQHDTLRLRLLLLAASPFGMAYDIIVGATPALVGGIFSAAIALVALLREFRERRTLPISGFAPDFDPHA